MRFSQSQQRRAHADRGSPLLSEGDAEGVRRRQVPFGRQQSERAPTERPEERTEARRHASRSAVVEIGHGRLCRSRLAPTARPETPVLRRRPLASSGDRRCHRLERRIELGKVLTRRVRAAGPPRCLAGSRSGRSDPCLVLRSDRHDGRWLADFRSRWLDRRQRTFSPGRARLEKRDRGDRICGHRGGPR